MLEVIQGWLEGTDHFLFVSWGGGGGVGGLKLKWSLYASGNFYSLSPLKHWPFVVPSLSVKPLHYYSYTVESG